MHHCMMPAGSGINAKLIFVIYAQGHVKARARLTNFKGIQGHVEPEARYVSNPNAHQGVSEFVYFFAENTKITPKITKFNKLNLAHTRLYIICIARN